jgi:hypothetical protein
MGASEVIGQGLFWPPVALDEVAEATGGLRHTPADSVTEPGGTFVTDFKRIFDEFRRSYVLRFTPTDIATRGWHELTVGVRLKGNYKVRARRGYFSG